MAADDGSYANIRATGLEQFIGKRLLDITQHDEDEYAANGQAYIVLMFEQGGTITVPIGDAGIGYDDGNDQPDQGESNGKNV